MTLHSNKVLGLDGLTVGFFREFWKALAPKLMDMYVFSYQNGTLPESVRQGIISLLPKKNKDTSYVNP